MSIRINDLQLDEGVIVEERYKILRKIGAGGFAKVFAARDSNVERDVAIKFLDVHTGQRSPDQIANLLARFKREATVAAQLSHPNVVNVFDFGIIDAGGPVPYIVMELLNGQDLDEYLQREGALDVRRAIRLFIPCLEGLGEAHRLGVVHKDLKPANLFLSQPGKRSEMLRLVDFGIAHFDHDASGERLTASGEILGTPQYLPPEYIKQQLVSPAFDIYQMGLILAEALSGVTVVNETNPFRCIMRHSQGDIEVPAPWADTVLGPVIKRAVAMDHTRRYVDGYAMADALAAIDLKALPTPEQLKDWHAGRRSGGSKTRSSAELVGGVASTDSMGWREPMAFDATVEAPSAVIAKAVARDLPVQSTQRGGQGAQASAIAASQKPQPVHHSGAAAAPIALPQTQPPAQSVSEIGPAAQPADALQSQRWMLLVIALCVVVALGFVILLVMTDDPKVEPALALSAELEVAAPKIEDLPELAKVVEPVVPAKLEPAVEVIEKPVEPIDVRIEVTPSFAHVIVNENSLGPVPSVRFDGPKAGRVTVVASAPGFEPVTFSLSPSDAPVLRLALKALPAKPVAEKTAVRPPRETKTSTTPPREDPPEVKKTAPQEFLIAP
ncbi:MAG: protein kinase [Bradymonadaceae bacterium]|nr:protein kinase [Lujinxingiaceae bacterium]